MLIVTPVESNTEDALTCIELEIKEDVWPEVMPVKSACELEAVDNFK